jgi:hypothetical protein
MDSKKDVIKYLKGDKNAGDFSSEVKSLLDGLAKFANLDNYRMMQAAFTEISKYYEVAQDTFEKIS